DDGLGPAVLRALEEQYAVPADVTVMDLGTPGLDLSPWLADADNVVLIDTVKAPLKPGSLRLYRKSELLASAPDVRVSPHDPGVKETLLNLEFAGRAPRELALVGVVPGETTMGLELSPAVAAAVPAAVGAVVAALERFGVVVTRRAQPIARAEWWRAGAAGSA
ncbi:MAG: hydrogenase maturation protease, partial [Vicinamibacterales bacterium]